MEDAFWRGLRLRAAAAVILGVGFADTSTAREFDAEGWTHVWCGHLFNVLTGKVVESSAPDAVACTGVKAAQIKVLNARSDQARFSACHSHLEAQRAFQLAKITSGRLWFGNYLCRIDCSGHDAGFGWAKAEDIRDPGDCPKNEGLSFSEGCQWRVSELRRVVFEHEHCDRSSVP